MDIPSMFLNGSLFNIMVFQAFFINIIFKTTVILLKIDNFVKFNESALF